MSINDKFNLRCETEQTLRLYTGAFNGKLIARVALFSERDGSFTVQALNKSPLSFASREEADTAYNEEFTRQVAARNAARVEGKP